MPHSLRRALLCCALLPAIGLPIAGCGSGDTKESNAYVKSVNAIQTDVANQVRQTAALISPSSTPASDGKALDQFDKAISSGVTRLQAVKTPDKVRTLHAKLITTIDRFHAAIAKARSGLGKKSVTDLATAQASFIQALNAVSADVTTTIDAINTKLHE